MTLFKKESLLSFILSLFIVLSVCAIPVQAASKSASLKVSASNNILYIGDTSHNATQLKVIYQNKNVTKSARYYISNKKIAVINKNGKVTAKKTGTVRITVKYKNNSKKITIKIKNAKLSLHPKKLSLTKGKTAALTVYANKTILPVKNTSWSTSDKSIATVSKTGVVKGLKQGVATITCKTSFGRISCQVTVSKPKTVQNNLSVKCSHKWLTIEPEMSTFQVQCNGCYHYFDTMDEMLAHALFEPVKSGCGSYAYNAREVVISAKETCQYCHTTRGGEVTVYPFTFTATRKYPKTHGAVGKPIIMTDHIGTLQMVNGEWGVWQYVWHEYLTETMTVTVKNGAINIHSTYIHKPCNTDHGIMYY